MSVAADIHEETETQRVERWRADALVRAGYDAEGAALIARRADVDLHAAVELIGQGCPVDLALEILL